MLPSDFISDFTPAASRHPESARMHKEAAHLTYSRKQDRTGGEWDILATMKPVAEISVAFLERVTGSGDLMANPGNRERAESLLQRLRPVEVRAVTRRFYASSSSVEIVQVQVEARPAAPDSGHRAMTGAPDPGSRAL